MKTQVMRWGVIGCGDVMEKKSGPAYQQTPGFELAAVMGRNAQKVEDYASRHKVEHCYTDAEALINDKAIDAVYIATPPDSHQLYALKVAAAGKPCCVEKPLAPTYHESMMIATVFKQHQIPLFVAYYRRSLPRFQQVKAWLDEKRIGELRHVNWHFAKPVHPKDMSSDYNWRTDANIAPAGYFDDLACHGLDLLIYLLGDIAEVSGVMTAQQNLYTAKDAVAACWLHSNGVTGSGSWNFSCHQREDRVTVSGSSGKIEFSVFADVPITLTTDNGSEDQLIANPDPIQLPHVRQMQKCLAENDTHPSTGESAAHTSWVMSKILGQI